MSTAILVDDYIEKLTLLEKRVGMKVHYRILDPFPVNTRDSIVVQTAAKRIAGFVGLEGMTFVISAAKQNKGVAGHISLRTGETDVFIELSPETMEHEASTLATLAHEISHKYQEIYGISWGTGLSDEYHNEVLTDITAVFLGLGKLLLNGCEHSTATQTPIFKDGNRYTQTTTHTHKCGYLTRKQLVFVYRLVCAMRGISPVTFTSNLSGEARAALSSCEREFDSYFLDSYRDADASDRETAKLQTAVRKLQRSLSEVERQRAYLTSAFRHAERSVTRRAHTHITGALSECAKVVTTQHHDPCLRYLAAMRARHVVTKAVRECDEFMREAESRRELLMGFSREVRLYKSIFPEPSSPMFAVVRCPHDGTELQVPEGSTEFIARCPKCAYEFFADTSVLVIEPFVPPQPDASSKTRDRQNSWEGVTRVSKFIKRVAERVKRAYRA